MHNIISCHYYISQRFIQGKKNIGSILRSTCWIFLSYWTPFPVIGYPLHQFLGLIFPGCLITYVQTCLSTMAPGGILHGGINVLSLSKAYNWKNSYKLHFFQSGWSLNLSLVLLLYSVTPGYQPTLSITCDIFQGLVHNI